MKLNYKNLNFKRIKKRGIHDQYSCYYTIENNFNVEIGFIIWNEYLKLYNYLPRTSCHYSDEVLNEIIEFLKQLNR